MRSSAFLIFFFFFSNLYSQSYEVFDSTKQSVLEDFIQNGSVGDNYYRFNLSQNYPNPFNPSTKFSFTIFETSKVNLTIYDVLGNEVVQIINDTLDEGYHIVEFTAANYLPSGVYFYRLQSGNQSKTHKMLLLK